jgi:hypothetical protein
MQTAFDVSSGNAEAVFRRQVRRPRRLLLQLVPGALPLVMPLLPLLLRSAESPC